MTEKLKEAAARLPPNPIDLLPQENLFKFTPLYQDGDNSEIVQDDKLFDNVFADIVKRYVNVFQIYSENLSNTETKRSKMLANNKIEVLEEF